jgi:outer membrane protein TolC
MTKHVCISCVVSCLGALLAPAPVGAQTTRSAGGRLTLDAAIRIAVENNRQVQSARLQVEKAQADVAAARTRRLPVFETEVTASQLMTPVGFAFPQGAFGEFPGTGPIPATDTTVSVPRRATT